MSNAYTTRYKSPVGTLKLEAINNALTAIDFIETEPASSKNLSSPVLQDTIDQLDAYFEGQLTTFNLPLAPDGTDFQQRVWEALRDIPYGQTVTYGLLAERLGDANKMRAVGTANGKNPIPIIIPCHRVVGANQQLVGYSGGIARKKQLLKHEGAILL